MAKNKRKIRAKRRRRHKAAETPRGILESQIRVTKRALAAVLLKQKHVKSKHRRAVKEFLDDIKTREQTLSRDFYLAIFAVANVGGKGGQFHAHKVDTDPGFAHQQLYDFAKGKHVSLLGDHRCIYVGAYLAALRFRFRDAHPS